MNLLPECVTVDWIRYTSEALANCWAQGLSGGKRYITPQLRTFSVWGKGKKLPGSRSGEHGGCGKTVTFSDFRSGFISDVCAGALSCNRQTYWVGQGYQFFACWVMFHASFVLCWFFQNKLFQKIISVTLFKCQRVCIQIRTGILPVLIWIQTFCKGYQQMTKVATSKKRVKISSIFIMSKWNTSTVRSCSITIKFVRFYAH